MLNVFRQGIGSWLVKGFMALLIASFVVWGIADVFRNFGTSSAAQIGDVKISPEAFRQTFSDRLQQISRQAGRPITPEQARVLGLDRQILAEIFSESALDQKAKALGLNVTNESLADKIQRSPEFAGPDGKFSHDYFLLVLRSSGTNEAAYVDNQRRLTLRQQIGQALAGDLTVPKVMSDALRRYQGEERSVEFVSLDKKDAGAIPAPTPEQLKAYYEEQKALFRAPEYRKLQMIVLTPETVAASLAVPDADLHKLYEEQKDRYGTPEKREVEQMVFDKPEDAAAAAAKIASGTSFDAIAEERKLAPKDVALGTIAKSEILDPAVANAAFSLPAGKVSAPVAGRFGTVLVLVKKIEASVQKPFEAVQDELRKAATTERARRELLDFHDKIEDERAGGATIPETAAKLNLKFETIDAVDRSGRKPDGARLDGIPGSPEVLSAAFKSPAGTDNDTVDLRSQGGYVWYDVVSITPSRERTFDEVRTQVETRWNDDQIGKKLASLADAIKTKLDSGETFAQAAPGLQTSRQDKIVRGKDAGSFNASAVTSIFDTPEGKSGVILAADGIGRIVYRVTGSAVPSMTALGTANTDVQLSRGFQDDLLAEYIQHVQNQLGVSVNEAAIRSVTGADKN